MRVHKRSNTSTQVFVLVWICVHMCYQYNFEEHLERNSYPQWSCNVAGNSDSLTDGSLGRYCEMRSARPLQCLEHMLAVPRMGRWLLVRPGCCVNASY